MIIWGSYLMWAHTQVIFEFGEHVWRGFLGCADKPKLF